MAYVPLYSDNGTLLSPWMAAQIRAFREAVNADPFHSLFGQSVEIPKGLDQWGWPIPTYTTTPPAPTPKPNPTPTPPTPTPPTPVLLPVLSLVPPVDPTPPAPATYPDPVPLPTPQVPPPVTIFNKTYAYTDWDQSFDTLIGSIKWDIISKIKATGSGSVKIDNPEVISKWEDDPISFAAESNGKVAMPSLSTNYAYSYTTGTPSSSYYKHHDITDDWLVTYVNVINSITLDNSNPSLFDCFDIWVMPPLDNAKLLANLTWEYSRNVVLPLPLTYSISSGIHFGLFSTSVTTYTENGVLVHPTVYPYLTPQAQAHEVFAPEFAALSTIFFAQSLIITNSNGTQVSTYKDAKTGIAYNDVWHTLPNFFKDLYFNWDKDNIAYDPLSTGGFHDFRLEHSSLLGEPIATLGDFKRILAPIIGNTFRTSNGSRTSSGYNDTDITVIQSTLATHYNTYRLQADISSTMTTLKFNILATRSLNTTDYNNWVGEENILIGSYPNDIFLTSIDIVPDNLGLSMYSEVTLANIDPVVVYFAGDISQGTTPQTFIEVVLNVTTRDAYYPNMRLRYNFIDSSGLAFDLVSDNPIIEIDTGYLRPSCRVLAPVDSKGHFIGSTYLDNGDVVIYNNNINGWINTLVSQNPKRNTLSLPYLALDNSPYNIWSYFFQFETSLATRGGI